MIWWRDPDLREYEIPSLRHDSRRWHVRPWWPLVPRFIVRSAGRWSIVVDRGLDIVARRCPAPRGARTWARLWNGLDLAEHAARVRLRYPNV